jgi:hypothetical protein
LTNARHGDLHAHAMRTIEHLWAIDRSRPIHGLMLAGDDEALVMLKQRLPRSLSRALTDAPAIDGDAIAPDIAHRVQLVEQDRREAEDGELVTRLLEEREGDLTVTGWDSTLDALNDGRVHVLVLAGEGARAGFFCPQDHFVTLQAASACPACGTELRATEHIGEAAVRSVLLRDGQVHVLAPLAATTFAPFGVGALLRY